MKISPPKVSVVLVVTTEKRELLECLVSLFESHQTALCPIEVIVAHNNPPGALAKVIAKKFPQVRYVNTGGNIGFGPGCNVGAAVAKGEYIFILNSDTQLEPHAIAELAAFLDTHPRAGVVAPTLLDMDGNRNPDQGSAELTPLTAVASHSILSRIWPTNPVANNYWLRDRDTSKEENLAVVPGTALMIRRSVYESVKGFDPQFFIYFEESDLCRRIRSAGWEVWQIPQSKVRHIWHAATTSAKYNDIFKDSRYKYFKKYYGSRVAQLMELALGFGKRELIWLSLGLLAGIASIFIL